MKVVLRYADGKFVDIDNASGGYPYKVETAWRAHAFTSIEDALHYASMFKKEFMAVQVFEPVLKNTLKIEF